MQGMSTKTKIFGILSFLIMLASWYWALSIAPSEEHMGEVYRIIYIHVPSAFNAFLWAYVLCFFSIMVLWKKNSQASLWARASAEIGLMFTVLTLATGSIWGRPTWGVWWVWDARLTTTLILALLFAGYLILYNSLAANAQRAKISAVLGIIIAADVPIIYKSVTWWRTLHQPPSLMRKDGPTMAPEMVTTIVFCLIGLILVASWLLKTRVDNLKLSESLERQSFEQVP